LQRLASFRKLLTVGGGWKAGGTGCCGGGGNCAGGGPAKRIVSKRYLKKKKGIRRITVI
jgi:hypothetical protein